jgi:hypothetical protein
MHHRTYWRLVQKAEKADALSVPPWLLNKRY